MDEQQRKAFEAAVERKKQAALDASRQQGAPTQPPDVGGSGGSQGLDDPSASQDDPTPHQKGTRHGQVTAENWNQ
jgi:hypothetical protein